MKKKFEIPESLIILFSNEDIILTSSDGPGEGFGQGGDEDSGDYPY